MSACGCGRATVAANGNCVICRGTVERGFCGTCLRELERRADGNWECPECHQVYYVAAPAAAAAEAKEDIEEETRPFNPEYTEEEKTQEENDMPKPKRKYTRRPKEEAPAPPIIGAEPTEESLTDLMQDYVEASKMLAALRGRIKAKLDEVVK